MIDCIMVLKRSRNYFNMPLTRTYPGADIGIDHGLIVQQVETKLERVKNESKGRTNFNLGKLNRKTTNTLSS